MEDPQSSDLLGQRKVRLEKLEELKKLGINPYPAESFREQEVGRKGMLPKSTNPMVLG